MLRGTFNQGPDVLERGHRIARIGEPLGAVFNPEYAVFEILAIGLDLGLAVIANVSMIVSSFFTFSPFLTGLGPLDDVAYPPVVTRSYFSLISDPYSLRSACSGLRPVTPCAFNQSSTRSKIGSHR